VTSDDDSAEHRSIVDLLDKSIFRKRVMKVGGELNEYFKTRILFSVGNLDIAHVVFLQLLSYSLPEERDHAFLINAAVEAVARSHVASARVPQVPSDHHHYDYLRQIKHTPSLVIAVVFGLKAFRDEFQIPYNVCQINMPSVLRLVQQMAANRASWLFDYDEILGSCGQRLAEA
jgi:hypothetical protein